MPEWSNLVKTSKHKELAPVDGDWYYVRCAAVLRRIYMRGKIGTTGIAKRYGGTIALSKVNYCNNAS